MTDFKVESSDDAYPIYQGRATVYSFGRSSGGNQFFVLRDLEPDKFEFLIKEVERNIPVIFHGGSR